VSALLLAACDTDRPNSTLTPHTDTGRAIDHLFDIFLAGGVIVFVLVAVALLYVIIRYRHRPGQPEPRQIHGNTTLEVTWTLIPALVLAVLAVPSVRTIFATQAPAPDGSLQVEVIGHQWWWEFRYPEYGIVTANELYLPINRPVNFALMTKDVLHSFWIPQLSGKRDLISNDTNYIWFTTDSTPSTVYNGFCAEYCGASHANMRFRVFTLPGDQFDRWAEHEKLGPVYPPSDSAAPPAPERPIFFAESQIPAYARPSTPLPDVPFTATSGDAARGAELFKAAPCIACHTIQGVSPGIVGPNLTHVGSRTTIAAGLYPNDFEHLTRWIKDAPELKAMNYLIGQGMPPMGKGIPNSMGLFDDQQIADIATYLLSLK
jgi:cytochrome c oxidase subunit 2